MTQSNYTIAFRVSVYHSYFESNVCNCLHFKPSVETEKLQKRFGFMIRNNINGFDFFSDSKFSLASLLPYIKISTNQASFDFEIESNDEAFSNFTEIPLDWRGQMHYNTNSASNYFENDVLVLGINLSEKMSSSTMGKLSVHFDDLLKYTAVKGYADLSIRLNARKTQWQYFVINKSSLSIINPVIKGNNGTVFNGPELVTIQSGEDALLFSSGENLLPLSRIPKYKFSLVDHITANETDTIKKITDRVIFKGLPNADPRRVSLVEINGIKQFLSPMYVFI